VRVLGSVDEIYHAFGHADEPNSGLPIWVNGVTQRLQDVRGMKFIASRAESVKALRVSVSDFAFRGQNTLRGYLCTHSGLFPS
jgi:hypothetical protein